MFRRIYSSDEIKYTGGIYVQRSNVDDREPAVVARNTVYVTDDVWECRKLSNVRSARRATATVTGENNNTVKVAEHLLSSHE